MDWNMPVPWWWILVALVIGGLVGKIVAWLVR